MRHIPLKAIPLLIRVTAQNCLSDQVPRLGAALAYYMALSLAPVLVILLAIASLAFGAKAAQGRVLDQIQGLVGREGSQVIRAMIEGAHRPKSGLTAILLGLVTLFVGATAAVSELKGALNTIWKVPDDSTSSHYRSVFNIVKDRVLSFALVLAAGLVLLASLLVSAWISDAGQYLRSVAPPHSFVRAVDWVVSLIVITLLFAFIFKVLPNVVLRWGDVVFGAIITSLLFTAGKYVLGVYLGRAGFTDTYGAAGSLVIFLVWVYYSAQVLFFGAEFTRAYACHFGSLKKAVPDGGVGLKS